MNSIMNKLTRKSILFLFLVMVLPTSAQYFDASEVQEAINHFINDKKVKITSGSYEVVNNPHFETIKDSAMFVEFTCKDAKPLNRVIKVFEELEHFADDSRGFRGVGKELTRALRVVTGSKDRKTNTFYPLSLYENARVLIFGITAEGLKHGFILQWNDLLNGEKRGSITFVCGFEMEFVKLEKGEDEISMDSVRTAIKIGEAVKGKPLEGIDTTYIDGKWAVTSKYHCDILRSMDQVSDRQDGFPALHSKICELVESCKSASDIQLASIGFALKREASRYELLLTPEQFALIWGGIYKLENKAKNADPQIQDYFKASEIILRSKINESVYLEWTDEKRHKFLQKIGFTVTKDEGGRPYFAVWGKHYSGNPDLEYLDGCCDEDGALEYTAEHVETDLKPGIYRVTAAGRASGHGESGAFIFAKTENNTLLKEIPACDDRGGDIWQQAAIRVKEADEKGSQNSPKDVRMALANGGMGYGRNRVVIDNIVVRDGSLTYGVTCDPEMTGKRLKQRWLSAVDFELERVGDLPKE